MLLRVDVYAGSAGAITDPSKRRLPDEPSQSPVYTCLRPNGVLLTIGRKTGDIVIGSDKSISREHCTIRLVSSHLQDVPNPRNEEEITACQVSSWHSSCVVLENKGKFGSFIVENNENISNPEQENESSNADTEDDATDDGGGSQIPPPVASQLPPISLIALKYTSPNAKLKAVMEGESAVLEDLAIPNGRAVIECGRTETTIVITRIDHRFVASGKNTQLVAMTPDLYKIGFQQLPMVDDTITLLVTPVLDCSPKQLSAWSYGVPFCTVDYLQTLLNRKSSSEKLPAIQDFPPGDSEKHPTPFRQRSANPQLWSTCVFFMTKHNGDKDRDIEAMMRATGAVVVPLYTQASTTVAVQYARQRFLDDKNKYGYFALNDRTKLAKALHDELGVPLVTTRRVAEALLDQRLPQDDHGNEIGNIKNHMDPGVDVTDSNGMAGIVDRNSGEEEVVTESIKHDRQASQDDDMPVTSPTEDRDNETNDQPFRQSVNYDGSKTSKRRRSSTVNDEVRSTKHKRHSTVEEDSRASLEKDVSPATDNKVPFNSTRSVLDKESNGWLSTAPRGIKRKECARSMIEIQKLANYEELLPVAPTVVFKGLVCAARGQTSASGVSDAVKDYKGFRKNHVERARGHFTFNVVLANQCTQQEVLEETTREFQEQQRLAEELFSNTALGVRKVVRRRR